MNPYRHSISILNVDRNANPEWSMVLLLLTALAEREDADPQSVVDPNPLREVLRRHAGTTFAHQRLAQLFSPFIHRIERQ